MIYDPEEHWLVFFNRFNGDTEDRFSSVFRFYGKEDDLKEHMFEKLQKYIESDPDNYVDGPFGPEDLEIWFYGGWEAKLVFKDYTIESVAVLFDKIDTLN